MGLQLWPHINSYIKVRNNSARDSRQNKALSLTQNKSFLSSGPYCIGCWKYVAVTEMFQHMCGTVVTTAITAVTAFAAGQSNVRVDDSNSPLPLPRPPPSCSETRTTRTSHPPPVYSWLLHGRTGPQRCTCRAAVCSAKWRSSTAHPAWMWGGTGFGFGT